VTPDGKPLHVDWRVHTVGLGGACLVELEVLRRNDDVLDRDGLLDDPDDPDDLRGLESGREHYNRPPHQQSAAPDGTRSAACSSIGTR
jgi:hypothetical protein